jgi:dihydroorotate dehydrogenase
VSGLDAIGLALLRLFPPETAHSLANNALSVGLVPGWSGTDSESLKTRLWGLDVPNPIGIAAGFDKDAEAFAPMLSRGVGFVEVGTLTPRPQPGNPKPRMFRLPSDGAVINRLGFNNGGMAAAAARLVKRDRARGIVGVNIGRNKDSADALADYVAAYQSLAPLADYVTVNISSPNTPGLRDLQARDELDRLIAALHEARASAGLSNPILVKIAPDLDDGARQDISDVALARNLDGLIISNTTIARPEMLTDPARDEAGGLSGRPLFAPSTALLADMYRRTGGKVVLIGVGGVASADDAYAKIRAGASLVQLYTALAYQGLGLIDRIKAGLADRLAADGFSSVVEAVGVDAES